MKDSTRYATAAGLSLALLLLTACIWVGAAENFDHVWRQFALDLDPPQALPFWAIISYLGAGAVVASLASLLVVALALLKQWHTARQIVFVMLCAVILENAMKWIVQRPRPESVLAYAMPSSFSFPSGHALFATALYGSFLIIATRGLSGWARLPWIILAVLVVLAIGASRIFLGVHYPSDVLAGFLAGALCLMVLRRA